MEQRPVFSCSLFTLRAYGWACLGGGLVLGELGVVHIFAGVQDVGSRCVCLSVEVLKKCQGVYCGGCSSLLLV
jgi:hypothetical protein